MTNATPRKARVRFVGALVCLIGLCIVAFNMTPSDAGYSAKTNSSQPVFASLDRENLDQINIVTSEASYSIERTGRRWIVPEKAHLPVSDDKMDELLTALETAQFTRAMTKLAERHDQLGLGAPETDGYGARIEINGVNRALTLGLKAGQQYGRWSGENQSWQISTLFPPLHSANWWVGLDSLVPVFDDEAFVSAKLYHRGGMIGPIEGDAAFLAEIFAQMKFEDVRRKPLVLDPSFIEVETVSSGNFTLHMLTNDSGSWLSFEVPDAFPFSDLYADREFRIDALSASELDFWMDN
ncbi:MAG: hypothetical protein CMK09_09805 [Ponticaulis sp.]|nr:hypothetical protein [Ponticaulis sp.]|tara:strand:- start:12373 stop:13260 length:888 start_codon:yes stop_codon:yes gene_type:complete